MDQLELHNIAENSELVTGQETALSIEQQLRAS
jgi:hypothetical protein